jgi:hypothetical protein
MGAFWVGRRRRTTWRGEAAVMIAVTAIALGVPGSGWAASAWTGPTVINKSQPPENISCPTATFCAAVGAGGYGQTFNGSSWGSPTNIDPSSNPSGHTLFAVSCPSASFCMAVDQAGNAVAFTGGGWSAPVAVDNTRNALTAVSCTSASFCVAGDGGGNGFIYNGSAWSAPVTINHVSNHQGVGGIACPATSFCVAVGEGGDVETSTNGGAAWSPTPVTIGSNNLTSVSCPSASFCVAVDTAGNAYTYNGTAWSGAAPIDTVNGQIDGGEMRAVSCPVSSFCAAIDGRESVLTFNGSTWSAPQQLETAALASGVSCASSSFCVAVDGGGNAFMYGAAVAAPVLGKTAIATPVSGVVFVKPPRGTAVDGGAAAGQGFVRLTAATQIPIGSEINSLHGSLKLVTAAPKKGLTQSGTFRGAIFRLTQAARGASKGLATLSLVESAFQGAPTYGVCTHKGKASVTDFVRRKTVVLHAGQSYLAKAPPGH